MRAIVESVGPAIMFAGPVILLPLLLLPLAVLFVPQVKPAGRAVMATLDQLSGFALSAAMGIAIVMMGAQLAVVIARYAFGLAFTWLNEIVIYAFAAMFLLAAAGALRDDAHVRADILRDRFGPKTRAIIELVGIYLFLVPICFLILWAAAPLVSNSWALLEGSRESDGLPFWYVFKTLIPVFAIFLLLQGISQAIKSSLRFHEDLPDPHEHPVEPGAL